MEEGGDGGWEVEFALCAGEEGGVACVVDVWVAGGDLRPAALGVWGGLGGGVDVGADDVVEDVGGCCACSVVGCDVC